MLSDKNKKKEIRYSFTKNSIALLFEIDEKFSHFFRQRCMWRCYMKQKNYVPSHLNSIHFSVFVWKSGVEKRKFIKTSFFSFHFQFSTNPEFSFPQKKTCSTYSNRIWRMLENLSKKKKWKLNDTIFRCLRKFEGKLDIRFSAFFSLFMICN